MSADACSPHKHRLQWQAGTHGKGILFASGLILTWPEPADNHRSVTAIWRSREGELARTWFQIRPSGEVRITRVVPGYAADRDAFQAALASADARLHVLPFDVKLVVRQEPGDIATQRWEHYQRRAHCN